MVACNTPGCIPLSYYVTTDHQALGTCENSDKSLFSFHFFNSENN